MIRKKLPYLFVLILVAITAFKTDAQTITKKPMPVKGIVIHNDSFTAIADVHIINKNTNNGWISNDNGIFNIIVSQHDTLLLSAIGYEPKEVVFLTSMLDNNKSLPIRLSPKVYKLEEVTINPYKPYNEFKKDFLTLEVKPENEVVKIPGIENIRPYDPSTNGLGPTLRIEGPITSLYNNFSRSGKARARSKILEQQLTNSLQASGRYNPKLVTQVTGLDGEELNKFMKFCTLPDAFILTASDYELFASINECYIAFLETSKSKTTDSFPAK